MKYQVRVLTFLLCTAVLAGAYSAFATDGTVNVSHRTAFTVYDATGLLRTNCAASRFSVTAYRDGSPVSVTPAWRNYTSGYYEAVWSPSQAGHYSGFINYSGQKLVPVDLWVRNYNIDTQYAAQSSRFGNVSSMANRRPVNPLLANDTRLGHLDADVSSRSTFSGGAVASVTGAVGSVAAPVTVGVNSDKDGYSLTTAYDAAKTAASAAGIDTQLSAAHGSGLWGGSGSVNVLPFQGSATYETAVQDKDVHIVRGDSVAVPYSIGKDITGWTVWFGAKANPADAEYAVPLREITLYVTDPVEGSGLISLSTADTSAPPRRYYAEIEIRRADEVNTPLRFSLWIDPDVVR